LHPEQRLQKPGLVERHAEKEPKRLHRRVDAGNAQRTVDQMQAEPAQIIEIRRLRRAFEKGGEVLDTPDVVLLRLLSKMTGGHIVDHALANRADRHTQLLLKTRLTPHSQSELSARLDGSEGKLRATQRPTARAVSLCAQHVR
jgi:hypothetical protein